MEDECKAYWETRGTVTRPNAGGCAQIRRYCSGSREGKQIS